MNIVVRTCVLAFFLLLADSVRAQAPLEADLQLVSRYVDQTAVAVVRFDIARIDTDAILNDWVRTLSEVLRERKPEALGKADDAIKEAREQTKKWRQKFQAAGGRDIFLVVAFNSAARPPIYGIAPTGPDAKPQELITLLADLPEQIGRNARAVEGGVVFGAEQLLEGKPLEHPERFEEIKRTFKHAGNDPILVALIPADFVRQSLVENMPELPAELGGGATTLLTKGLIAGWGSLSPAPSWSFKLIAESESEEAAQQFAAAISKAVEMATAEADPALAKEVRGALKARAEGSLVVIGVGNDRFTALKRELALPLMRAREAARRMVLAMNMRQAIMGAFIFAQDNNDQWPQSLQELVDKGIIQAGMLKNPERPELEIAYHYLRPIMRENQADIHEIVVMYEMYEKWPEEGMWVGFADGHIAILTDEAKFKEMVERSKKQSGATK